MEQRLKWETCPRVKTCQSEEIDQGFRRFADNRNVSQKGGILSVLGKWKERVGYETDFIYKARYIPGRIMSVNHLFFPEMHHVSLREGGRP